MRIAYVFLTSKNISGVSNGNKLIDIIEKFGLSIEKVGEFEPIQKEFGKNVFEEIWKGRGATGDYKSCCFLFKGKKEISFSGMVTWNINLHPNSRALNGVFLNLTLKKGYDFIKLIQLGDELFMWSEAIHGYITEESKNPLNQKNYFEMSCSINDGIPPLMWVNYFGAAYMKEPDLCLPDDHVPLGHGARLVISDTPMEDKLSDLEFLNRIKMSIGEDWFSISRNEKASKIPVFDRTEITRR